MTKLSRLQKNEQKKALMRIVFVLFITTGLILLFVFNFSDILFKISSLIIKFNVSEEAVIKEDAIAPFPPHLQPLPSAVRESSLSISGYAEPQASIKLFINKKNRKNSEADSKGKFEFKNIKLSKGENVVYAVAVDEAGNESKKSSKQIVELKTEGPSLEIEKSVDEENGQVLIKGTTDARANISINERRVVVGKNGHFSAEFELKEGSNVFKITAEDEAGNQSKKELTIDYSSEEE